MELIINLLQFSVTLLGFCLSGIRYLRHRTLSYFLLICFYGCFALSYPIRSPIKNRFLSQIIVSVVVFRNTTDLLCIGIRLGLQRYFSLSPTIYSLLPGGKKLFLSEIPAGSADRSSVVRILLYLW